MQGAPMPRSRVPPAPAGRAMPSPCSGQPMWRAVKQERIEEKFDEVLLRLRQQQAQLDELFERSSALHACLEEVGVIRPASYATRLHRQRFERMMRRYPCRCCDSLGALVQTWEMAFTLARLCGPEGASSLAAASRTLDLRMREAQPRLAAFFS